METRAVRRRGPKRPRFFPSPALQGWVNEFARDRAFSNVRLLCSYKGGQARAFVFEAQDRKDDGVRFVLKSFDRHNEINSVRAVMREYQAVKVLYSALANSRIDVVCPAPLGTNVEEWAYLCGCLDGRPLNRMVGAGKMDRRVIVRRVLTGLDVFYQTVGEPYGDCKPSNVLVEGNHVGMIDPITPDLRVELVARQGSFAPASGDLGYWMYGLVIDTLVGIFHGRLSPSELPRQVRFGRMLAAEAATQFASSRSGSAFLDEVHAAALQHFIYLREEDSSRQQVLAHTGMEILAALLRQDRRSPRVSLQPGERRLWVSSVAGPRVGIPEDAEENQSRLFSHFPLGMGSSEHRIGRLQRTRSRSDGF